MSIVALIILIVIVGAAVTLIPNLDPRFKNLLYVIVVVAVLIWLLSLFGLIQPLHLR